MKVRIFKLAFSLALVIPASFATCHFVRTANLNQVAETVLFYGDLPARIGDAVTNFRTLPERMNPTFSECN
jgi:hypothetical protein